MLHPPPPTSPAMAVSDDERAFYVQLGQRIAGLRRDRGLTQVQLAEALGVAQQTLAHYEAGRLRLLAGALPTLADQLGVSVEDLIGTPARRTTGKRGPAPRMQQQLEQLSRLPRAKQRIVSDVIESLIAQSAR